MLKGPSSATGIQIDKDTQMQREAYFQRHYETAAHIQHQDNTLASAIAHPTFSLSQIAGKARLETGDAHYDRQEWTLAIDYYLRALQTPIFLCEGLFKIGLCLEKGVDITQTNLPCFPVYKRHQGHTLNHNQLAAVFFREMLALNSDFTDMLHRSSSLNPYFIDAIYHLGLCISKGGPVQAQDLMNTPVAGLKAKTLNPKKVAIMLYKRAMILNPSYAQTRQQYEQSLAEWEDKPFTQNIRPLIFCGTGTPTEQPAQVNPYAVLSSVPENAVSRSHSRTASKWR